MLKQVPFDFIKVLEDTREQNREDIIAANARLAFVEDIIKYFQDGHLVVMREEEVSDTEEISEETPEKKEIDAE